MLPSKPAVPSQQSSIGPDRPNKCDPIPYPKESLELGEKGVVRLRFHVDANGDVIEGKVLISSGSRRLDRAALEGLARCKFKPGLNAEGQPIEGYSEFNYTWKLE